MKSVSRPFAVCCVLALSGLCLEASPKALGLFIKPRPIELPRWEDDPVSEKLKTIVLPLVEFDQTPLAEAVAILAAASVEHDPDPSESDRGVNLLLRPFDEELRNRPITLRLTNVPLASAIHYLAKEAGCTFWHKGKSVAIIAGGDMGGGPWEVWYVGYLSVKSAQDLESIRPEESRKRYRQALNLCRALREKHPGFHPEMVEDHIHLLEAKVDSGR